jgi:hypothetical protein
MSIRRSVTERRINKRVTIALHEDDKSLGETQLRFKIIPPLASGNGGAENEVILRCHCDPVDSCQAKLSLAI